MSYMPRLRVGEKTDLKGARRGKCAECGRETYVRSVEYYSMFARPSRETSRGFMNICYKCFGPRILWKSKEHGDMQTPMNIPYEKLDEFIQDYFKDRFLIHKVGEPKDDG